MIRVLASLIVSTLAMGLQVLAEDIAILEEAYGPHDLAMVSGMGRLTVGVNPRGRISLCNWPSPGFDPQISYRTRSREEPDLGVAPGDGLFWGLQLEGQLVWMNDARWIVQQNYAAPSNTIMITQARWPGTEIVVTQRVSVVYSPDAFISEIAVQGLPTQPRIYWYANFSPSTRHVPEIPGAYWMTDRVNDFAAFTDRTTGRVVHFRPRSPGRYTWLRAKEAATTEEEHGIWPAFPDGTWIGYQPDAKFLSAYCGVGPVTPSEAVRHLVARDDRESSASGQCYSVVEVSPQLENERFVASISVAFGKNSSEVNNTLDIVENTSVRDWLQKTAEFQEGILAHATFPSTGDPLVETYLRRALSTLRAATDFASGATVRSPASQPPLARDWPRHGAWIIYALDLSGSPVLAQRHIEFYLNGVRTQSARGKPMGSIASSFYADGVEASPHLIVDDEAVAWLLWAIRMHGELLSGARRDAYFESTWAKV